MPNIEEEQFILANEKTDSSRDIEERLARQSEGPFSRSTTTEPIQRVDRDETIAALEREMARISAQLSRLSANLSDDTASNGNIAHRNYSAEEEALRSLQTPSSLRDLTTFDGNPLKLNQFIKAVDRIMPLMEKVKNSPTFDVWMQSIRAKIVGEADTVLEMYGTDIEWDEIKNNLITHYSDKRDEVSLTMDLFHTKQTGSVQEFYERITHIVSLLVNQLMINESDTIIRNSKRKVYQEQGLKVFLAGLLPPALGSNIRSQNPTSLKDALRRCLVEDNIAYLQRSARALPSNVTNISTSSKPPNTPNTPPNHTSYQMRPPGFFNKPGMYSRPTFNKFQNQKPHTVPFSRIPPPPQQSQLQKPYQNFHNRPGPSQFRRAQSERMHMPNFQMEEIADGYEASEAYWPDDYYLQNEYFTNNNYGDMNNAPAWAYDDPHQVSGEMQHEAESNLHAHNRADPKSDTPDELNFHLAEQSKMKK